MSRAMQIDIVANDKASATMGNVEKSMENFGKGLGSRISMIAGKAALLVATFQKVSQVINEVGQVADEAARLGVTPEQYQKLKFAAEDYGSSVEEIAKAHKDINKLLDAAATKRQGPEVQTLQALGFSDADIINRNIKQAEVFERLSDAIKSASTEEEKFAIASRVLGDKIATSLVPVIENYDKFNSLMGSTSVMSGKAADNLDKLGTQLNGFWQFLKAGSGELMGRAAGAILPSEGPVLANDGKMEERRKRGEDMKKALLNVGGAKPGADKVGNEAVTSLAAIGGASFRGVQLSIAKPIEEQQLAALEQIASNTSPQTPTPSIGATDGTKAPPAMSYMDKAGEEVHRSGKSTVVPLGNLYSSQRKPLRPAR